MKKTIFIPLILPIILVEVISIAFKLYYLGFLIIPTIFAWIHFSKVCRLYESIWLFTISAIALVPYNIILVIHLYDWLLLCLEFVIYQVAIIIFIAISSFCIEELILGIIGRFIWRRQKRVANLTKHNKIYES